jgi:hypothetical protein
MTSMEALARRHPDPHLRLAPEPPGPSPAPPEAEPGERWRPRHEPQGPAAPAGRTTDARPAEPTHATVSTPSLELALDRLAELGTPSRVRVDLREQVVELTIAGDGWWESVSVPTRGAPELGVATVDWAELRDAVCLGALERPTVTVGIGGGALHLDGITIAVLPDQAPVPAPGPEHEWSAPVLARRTETVVIAGAAADRFQRREATDLRLFEAGGRCFAHASDSRRAARRGPALVVAVRIES